jgi:signal recognition particle subunit SRP72
LSFDYPKFLHSTAMAPDAMTALARLLQRATIEDHEDVLKAAIAALKENPNDVSVHHTRAVALLKLDRFDELLRVLDGAGDKTKTACAVERGYALYKTGRLEEARACFPVSELSGDPSPAMSHLAAQIAYRTENFRDAHAIYQRLASKAGQTLSEDRDLMINKAAARAQLVWQTRGAVCISASTIPKKPDTFEVAYNAACASIACGQLSKASMLLDQATRLCDGSDLSDNEKQAEMVSIMTQQACVYSLRGMSAEASAVYARLGGTT